MLIKGFMNIQSLLSNTTGVVAPLGELSPMGLTYSKEIGYYKNAQYPDYTLITFTSVNAQGQHTTLNNDQVLLTIRLVNFIRTYINGRIPPYNINNIRSACYEFFQTAVRSIEIGALQYESIGTLPQWISYTNNNDNSQYLIWLCDEAFTHQFDEFINVVVPPLANIDDFFQPTNIIANRIASESIEKLIKRIDIAKEGDPETYIRILTFDYVDPINRTLKIPTEWGVIIYGDAGDNIDSIKDALIEYILTHSTHSRAEWEVIFPDIFRRTEFIFVPRWDIISIPNMLTQTGLYGSIIDPIQTVEFVKNKIPFYTTGHIQNNTYVAPHPYKTLMMAIINGQYNVETKRDFRVLFNDYLPVPTTSMDFNRMSLQTQKIAMALMEMMIVAEEMTRFSFIQKPMKRVFRHNKLYLTQLIDNVNYVVVPKSTLLEG